jgi:anti-sigma factor RsiW
MNLSDEVLMAYADGELDSKTRAEVENAMAADPQIARRVAEHKALRDTLHASYDKVLDEPIPERLLATARARVPSDARVPPEKRTGDNSRTMRVVPDSRGATNGHGEGSSRGAATDNVVPLRRRPPARRPMPYWGAIAASFVVGALAWHFGAELISPAPLAERNGQLLASGALDRALSTQLVKEQDAQSAVQIGVSFRSKDGSYCRTFQLRGGNNLAGLACHQQDKWRLDVLAQAEAAPAGHPEFRPAASSLPPAISQAVDQAIAGEPLDAAAESQARTNQWRSP